MSIKRFLISLSALPLLVGTVHAAKATATIKVPASVQARLRASLKAMWLYPDAERPRITITAKRGITYVRATASLTAITDAGPATYRLRNAPAKRFEIARSSVRYDPRTGKLFGGVTSRSVPLPR